MISFRSLVLAATVAGGTAIYTPAVAEEPISSPTNVRRLDGDLAQGHLLFQRYCGACHGMVGRGDGFVGSALKERPADLTRIALKSGGSFPKDVITEIIDGRALEQVHGARQMPVWGERLGEEVSAERPRFKEQLIRSRIELLVAYLESIQAKKK